MQAFVSYCSPRTTQCVSDGLIAVDPLLFRAGFVRAVMTAVPTSQVSASVHTDRTGSRRQLLRRNLRVPGGCRPPLCLVRAVRLCESALDGTMHA